MVENILPKTAVQAAVVTQLPKAAGKTTAGELSFKAVFEANLNKGGELKFSAHAQDRLASRQINLSPSDLQRLEGGISRAAAKGARESLVVKDDLAFVVSITNR